MQIVGVDFGTTNVRIATWDSSRTDTTPQPVLIGQGDASTMPAVIALQRRPGGAIATLVGEDADLLEEDNDDTVVVRNIKRWALSGDRYVDRHLETRKIDSPNWWNPETRSVVAWDQEFPVWEIIRQILAEAFRRANLNGGFEWRAGCPIHAGLDYRASLARVLSGFGGDSKVASVVEEPVLLLELALRLGTLQPGSYLVYDVGGGSFDCALAEVEAEGRMTVYSAQGNPVLGGDFIDQLLVDKLRYKGERFRLRGAKENLTPSSPLQDVDGRVSLTWDDLESELNQSRFLDWTRVTMRETYITAKVLWKWETAVYKGDLPSCPLGEIPEAFRQDLDAVILTGGPTKSPYFRERLKEQFGADLVVAAEDLVPPEIPDPELTSLSMGACYVSSGDCTPLYVNRLPARVTLQDTTTGKQVEYEPYQHFVDGPSPVSPFISDRLPPQHDPNAAYVLTIADGDGTLLERKAVDLNRNRVPRDASRSPQLVIDTLGRVWVDDRGTHWVGVEHAPWQTARQRERLQHSLEQQRASKEAEKARVHRILTENPFGWQAGHG